MNEYEAALVVRAGAEMLRVAAEDPRSDEGYVKVKVNISTALNDIAEALRNFETELAASSRSAGWVEDLHRVADDLARK